MKGKAMSNCDDIEVIVDQNDSSEWVIEKRRTWK